jgi:hypothetical protein
MTISDDERKKRRKVAFKIMDKMIRVFSRQGPEHVNFLMHSFSRDAYFLPYVILCRLENGENPQFLENFDLNGLGQTDVSIKIFRILEKQRQDRAVAVATANLARSQAPIKMLPNEMLQRITNEATPSYFRVGRH